jgi:hypothetical protein
VAGTLLVPNQDVTYVRRVEERVVCGEDRPARDAEDGLGTHLLERPHQRLGPRDGLGGIGAGRRIVSHRYSSPNVMVLLGWYAALRRPWTVPS